MANYVCASQRPATWPHNGHVGDNQFGEATKFSPRECDRNGQFCNAMSRQLGGKQYSHTFKTCVHLYEIFLGCLEKIGRTWFTLLTQPSAAN